MSSTTKNRVLLCIISLLVVSQVSLVLMAHSQAGKAWLNRPSGYGSSLGLLNSGEIEDFRFGKHYGTHQWIADSAIRIIYDKNKDALKNSVGSKYWFFDPSIRWDRFDKHSTKGKWATTEYVTLGSLSNPFKDFSSKEEKYYAWKAGRRYIRYLHGSYWSDYSKSHGGNTPEIRPVEACNVFRSQFDAPPSILIEEKKCKTHESYLGRAHYLYFPKKYMEGSEEVGYTVDIVSFENDKPLKGEAPTYHCAKEAYECFLENMGSKQKTELALLHLGSMTHYIADVAQPCHITEGRYLLDWNDRSFHDLLEEYVRKSENFKTEFSESGYGKPDWDELDPTDYGLSLSNKGFRPERAVLLMAKYSLEITSKFMKENKNLSSEMKSNLENGKFDKLLKDLLAHAVYYCAEAVTYALQQSEAKYLNIHPLPTGDCKRSPIRDEELEPLDTDDITNWVDESEVQDGSWVYYKQRVNGEETGDVVAVLRDDEGNISKAALISAVPALAAELGDGKKANEEGE